ncbi:unnamed protein product [Hymenolepis diminuta]|uniref:Nuclear pore protein n=1 Tax=Hymenolepis diminuta TaxID=6216 RepID=A0A158QD52_HYMDI|nr:unnamed protein product [Hymenolepis diminuta]VUZ50411.1 unnamed protein product [Hymenolepis diminuta]
MESLEDLVEQSDRLLMEIQGDTDLPLITRSLDQMGSFSERLCAARGVRSDVKAARLLGPTINYDLPNALAAKLESLSQIKEVEFTKPKVDMDIHTFLRCERDNILFTASEQAKRSVFEEVDAICRRSTSSWWDRQAAAILTALASSSGPIDSVIFQSLPATVSSETGREFLARSGSLDFAADPQASILKEELYYANQVDKYLVDTLSTTQTLYLRQVTSRSGSLNRPPLFDYLYNSQNAQSIFFDESKQNDFYEIFRLIKRMFVASALYVDDIGSSETPLLDLPLPNTHEKTLEARTSSGLQAAFLSRAVAHLEAEFITYLQSVVTANPRIAQLGGRPGVRALVRAYLNTKSPVIQVSGDGDFDEFMDCEDGIVDGKPVWPMIYYCLRCGALSDAVSIASDGANNLGDFVQTLTTYVNEGRNLPPRTLANVRKAYRRVVKSSRDPYKRLVFCLLGRCDLADAHTEVCQNIDDFLWLRFSQISTNEDVLDKQDDIETLTLGQLQNLLYETYGETYFDAWNQPLTYFKILCLSQQFEAALGFLSRIESLRCHAVHLALILRELKILLLPKSKQAPLTSRVDSDPSGIRRLNFIRLLLLYTRKFESSGNPALCINYYYFLHDIPAISDGEKDVSNADTRGSSLFVQCVAELAIQTGEFDSLLGRLTRQVDGSSQTGGGILRQPGAIDRFASVALPISLITAVAEMLEARGQMYQAVGVYLLAGEAKSLLAAVRLTNLLLVGVVALDDGNGAASSTVANADRDNILRLAAEVGHSVRRIDPIATSGLSGFEAISSSLQSAAQTLYYLLDLATFFDLAASGNQYQAAIDHMDRLSLLPTSSEEVETKVAAFATLSDLVRRPLPSAVLVLMRCLALKAASAKSAEERSTALDRPPVTFGVGLGSSGRSLCLAELRARTRALITFVGRIPHRMPSEVYARLSQLEMQLASST